MHKSKPRANPILINGIIIVYVLKTVITTQKVLFDSFFITKAIQDWGDFFGIPCHKQFRNARSKRRLEQGVRTGWRAEVNDPDNISG